MARGILSLAVILVAGEPPKIIEEFIGRVNSQTSALSIAKMTSPTSGREPGQTPEFDEHTVVWCGELQVETRDATHKFLARHALVVSAGEWVRYSTPGAEGAEYLAVCLPAFSPHTVHREKE
jgi:hypothetical protein